MWYAEQALIDAENKAKMLQMIGAGMVEQLGNDLHLATTTYQYSIALVGGVEKIGKLIPCVTDRKLLRFVQVCTI